MGAARAERPGSDLIAQHIREADRGFSLKQQSENIPENPDKTDCFFFCRIV